MKKIVSVILLSTFVAQTSWAAPFNESQDKAKFVQGLASDTNGGVFGSLMNQLMQVVTDCGTAAGLTAGAAVIDTVPVIGAAKSVGAISKSALSFLKYMHASLKLSDLPYFIKTMEILQPIAGKLGTMTPDALKAFLAKALPHAGVNGVYAERVGGAILGFHAEAPKDLAQAVDTIGPHILGGGITALMDYGLFKGMSNGLGIDRSDMPEGKITREAYRATIIAANEGFSENSACSVSKSKLESAMDEILMRNHMIDRPGQITAPAPAPNTVGLAPAIATNRAAHPDAIRPYGGADNGGPDFAPKTVSVGAR